MTNQLFQQGRKYDVTHQRTVIVKIINYKYINHKENHQSECSSQNVLCFVDDMRHISITHLIRNPGKFCSTPVLNPHLRWT